MNICVVDDEIENIENLKKMLNQYSKENNVEFNITSFNDGWEFISTYKPIYDIVFLDIVMPKMNGLEAAEKLRNKDKVVLLIFITNMSKYAVKGYEYNAVSYVLKPLEYDNLKEAINKALDLINQNNIHQAITLQTKEGFIKIPLFEFMYADVIGHTVTVHTLHANYVVKDTLSSLAKKLEKYHFIQCSVCYLLNPRHITLTTKDTFYIGQIKFPISRLRRKEVMKTLMDFFNE